MSKGFNSSAKKQAGSGSKTPLRDRSKTALTVQKYINAKLEYSEQKKLAFEKVLVTKDDRIRQLESEVRENQQLVKDTLEKWKHLQTKMERQREAEMVEMENKVSQLKQSFIATEREVSQKFEVNRRLEMENEVLRQANKDIHAKYHQLVERYKKDRKQWSEVCEYVNLVINGIHKLPPNIFSQYFS